MKNAAIIGGAIIVGFIAHALLTSSTCSASGAKRSKKDPENAYGKYRDVREYVTVSRFKQSAIDQLSDLQAKVVHINGKDYYYLFLVDEDNNGKGVTWDHHLYKIENDSLIEIAGK